METESGDDAYAAEMTTIATPSEIAATAPPAAMRASKYIDSALSEKLRFWSLMAMVLLVYVHAFNLHPRYLQPTTTVGEQATWDNALQYFFANGLLRFRIPILFAISGYLFAWRDDGGASHTARVLRRVRTLGVPYLAGSAIAIAITWGLEQWATTRTFVEAAGLSPYQPTASFVGQYSTSQLVDRWLFNPAAFQLWFLKSLIVLTLCYPLLRAAVTRWPRTFFSVAFLLWLPDTGAGFQEGLLFYPLGLWLAAQRIDPMDKPTWMRVSVMLTIWIVSCGIRTWMAFALREQTTAETIGMLLLYRVGEISGLLAAWYGSDRIAHAAMSKPWFRWVSAFSFVIYALHVPAVNFATEAALHYGEHIAHIHLLTYAIVPPLVSATAVLIGAAMRTVARPVYGVLTGGRGL